MDPAPANEPHALADAEHQRLALIEAFDHINQGVSYFDADFRLEVCNRRYLALLNFPIEFGQHGTPFETFIRYNAERGEYGPGDADVQVAERVAMARQRKAHRFERARPDGTTLEIIGVPLENGGFVTTYADITERKRHERLLEEAQQRTELALEGAALGLWDWDVADDRFTVDNRYRDILGIAHDLNLSKDEMRLRMHPEDRAGLRSALQAHLEGRSPQFAYEHRALHMNESWVWLHARGKIVGRDPAGKPLRLTGTVQDITERKRNEALLLERERRLATLVRSMQDLIFVLDTGGGIAEFWPVPNIDLGLDAASAVGREFTEVLPAAMIDGIAEGMAVALVDGGTTRFEFAVTAPQPACYQVNLSRLADSGKYATGFLVVVRDITEVQRLREELAKLTP